VGTLRFAHPRAVEDLLHLGAHRVEQGFRSSLLRRRFLAQLGFDVLGEGSLLSV
jgi:hypothetical protein